MRNTLQENLTEHSYDTAVIAQALALIGNRIFGKCLDHNEIAAAALYHDCSEIITGDMPTPIKHKNPTLHSAYKAVECSAKERLLYMLPPSLRADYEGLLCYEQVRPELYVYIKAADKISAYLKCILEEKQGNHDFSDAKSELFSIITGLNMAEADYFMEHFAPHYGSTLDTLTKQKEPLC